MTVKQAKEFLQDKDPGATLVISSSPTGVGGVYIPVSVLSAGDYDYPSRQFMLKTAGGNAIAVFPLDPS